MATRRCHAALLTALGFVYALVSVCAAPFVLFSAGKHHEGEPSRQGVEPAQYPDTLTAKPIPYKWGFGAVTDDFSRDAELYEDQLSALLNGPVSDWQSLARDGYTFAARPIEIAGQQEVVMYSSIKHSTPGGRAFFEYLMTPEGQVLIDPTYASMAEARAVSKTILGPNYATIFPVAQITKLPPRSLMPTVIYEGAFHWQMCDEHQLTQFAYPAHVHAKDRLPAVQKLSGGAPEYTVVYALRLHQLDSDTIELRSVVWNSLLRGFSVQDALQALEEPIPGFIESVRNHLEHHSYPAATGDECDSTLEEGGFGVMGDVETLMSILESGDP